ncbi:hypothetical protein CRG98_026224 [Punica granatum]|uniref:Uncharacterized protein n=1 Tax=Punica granatum TaxID=22663 RepID=A0A2I0JAV3_PUNGR|nr:hypothetical protein CRG98_026224 [Punica granatum]
MNKNQNLHAIWLSTILTSHNKQVSKNLASLSRRGLSPSLGIRGKSRGREEGVGRLDRTTRAVSTREVAAVTTWRKSGWHDSSDHGIEQGLSDRDHLFTGESEGCEEPLECDGTTRRSRGRKRIVDLSSSTENEWPEVNWESRTGLVFPECSAALGDRYDLCLPRTRPEGNGWCEARTLTFLRLNIERKILRERGPFVTGMVLGKPKWIVQCDQDSFLWALRSSGLVGANLVH